MTRSIPQPTLCICLLLLFCHLAGPLGSSNLAQAEPLPPLSLLVKDAGWDAGTQLKVVLQLPKEFPADQEFLIEQSAEYRGLYAEVARVKPTEQERQAGTLVVVADKLLRGERYWFRAAGVQGVGEQQQLSPFVKLDEQTPGIPGREWFDGKRGGLAFLTFIVCGSVVAFIAAARRGRKLNIRSIGGLEAIEEAVGRATEMGRSCLFVPGILDMNDIQTIAGLTILSRVAEQAAEYDCELETPTSKSLVMTAAREAVATAFLKAGRPDAYNDDLIYYVTDEQFAYVSFLTGKMVREKPAACFYLGGFFAESLILAETGNSVGAIQIAGTAQPAQLPFFVAACDYTLIGEEFFAASAYLSGDPDQLGSLKGQDVGKIIVGGLILLGVSLLTLTEITGGAALLTTLTDFLLETVLQAA